MSRIVAYLVSCSLLISVDLLVPAECAIFCQYEPKLRARCQPVGSADNILTTRLTIADASAKFKQLIMKQCKIQQIAPEVFADLGDIESINLAGNSLSFLQEDVFHHVSKLTSINLSSNQIGAISPAVFSNLTHLKKLDLSKNTIAVSVYEPVFLINQPNLKILNLVDNLEIDIGQLIRDQSLVSLLLSNNQVTLPEGSIDLPSLTNLHLSQAGLSSVKDVTFHKMENLTSLDLSHNSLTELPPSFLSRNIKLKFFDVSHNKLKTLDDSIFINNVDLCSLDLSHNSIILESKSIFSSNVNLLHLDMSYNAINKINILLLQPLNKLLHLNLRNNKIKSLHSVTFNKNRQLKSLNLDGNQIETFQSLVFSSNVELHELTVSGNGFAAFPYTLVQNLRNLMTLDLSKNNLTSVESQITNLPELKTLHISCNLLHTLEVEFFETDMEGSESIVVRMHGNPFSCSCIDGLLSSSAFKRVRYATEYFSDGDSVTCIVTEGKYCKKPKVDDFERWLMTFPRSSSVCTLD